MIPLPAWLTGLGVKLLLAGAFMLVLLGAVLKLIGIGRSQERGAQAQRTVETQKRITDADAAGPRTADDVDKRLHDGTF